MNNKTSLILAFVSLKELWRSGRVLSASASSISIILQMMRKPKSIIAKYYVMTEQIRMTGQLKQ